MFAKLMLSAPWPEVTRAARYTGKFHGDGPISLEPSSEPGIMPRHWRVRSAPGVGRELSDVQRGDRRPSIKGVL